MITRQALGPAQIIGKLAQLEGWKLFGDGPTFAIEKTFRFKNYLATLSFANAVAFLAEQQDHHPDMLMGYSSCSVRWRTHDVHGVSVTDFSCAALTDALLQPKGPEGQAIG